MASNVPDAEAARQEVVLRTHHVTDVVLGKPCCETVPGRTRCAATDCVDRDNQVMPGVQGPSGANVVGSPVLQPTGGRHEDDDVAVVGGPFAISHIPDLHHVESAAALEFEVVDGVDPFLLCKRWRTQRQRRQAQKKRIEQPTRGTPSLWGHVHGINVPWRVPPCHRQKCETLAKFSTGSMSAESPFTAGSEPHLSRLGSFQIDRAGGRLMHGGREVPLRAKTWQLLLFLANRPGRLCSHDELVGALWPRRVVCDDSLVQCVCELRRALADRNKQIVRTVARRGYRLEPAALHAGAAGR